MPAAWQSIMYVLFILIAIASGLVLLGGGVVRRSRPRAATGVALLLLTPAFFLLLSWWGELLWFDALGYRQRFWTELLARIGVGAAGALLGAGVVTALAWPARIGSRRLVGFAGPFAALLGAAWGAGIWDVALRHLHAAETGVADPIRGRDVGFYLFSLPFYDELYRALLLFCALAVAVLVLPRVLSLRRAAHTGTPSPSEGRNDSEQIPAWRLPLALVALGLVLASGRVLDTYHLLFSDLGAVTGPGWTDVHVRLPVYWAAAVALLVVPLLLLWPAARRRVGALGSRIFGRSATLGLPVDLAGLAKGWAALLIAWILFAAVVPALVQWLVVEPNEISFERPYIAHNIELTRQAFGLDEAEEREFAAAGEFTEETVESNRHLLSEIRLWDWHALDAVYKQFQEIRLYYEFFDVDVDRYRIGDRYRQVMVSARELVPDNLPEPSQTFVNQRFKYTHGFGITLAPVSDFTAQGLPNLLVRDIPPKSEVEDLEVEQPRIYYGELSESPVYVNTEEEEFDYPSGDENVFVRYDGEGGVRLANLWRKFLFGWKFDGTRFLLSGYPRAESRVLFHRSIQERVRTLAPFLEFDEDPYVALVDGRLLWIVDAYTSSSHYPYSARFDPGEEIEYRNGGYASRVRSTTVRSLGGANYVRNSVKAVVDAYHGSVTLWVVDEDDPVIEVWRRIFPELFRSGDEMPDALRAHLRYPVDLLLTQGLVYARYHMLDPDVFYNQEDLWVRATEKYYGDVRPVEPYYVMWQPPGSEQAEFVLMLPFTPKNRQVLIGWIAGMCDPGNYGRFLAYKFPKERRVLGPQQVETKIDQDPFLSGQLTLWDQRGSTVIRGNVLAIPIDQTLLYVEPIYLRAETAAYPELRLVALMHEDELSYSETFDDALAGLLDEGERPPIVEDREALAPPQVFERARELLEEYQRLQGEGRFEEAGRTLEELRELLASPGPPSR